jgi:RES domain-containing protein
VRAYRIGTQRFARTKTDAFSGQGSLYGDGRWHHRGRLAVYVAQHASLATLEILVHLKRTASIEPHVFWEVEIPDALIERPDNLPARWRTDLEATRTYGDAWLARKSAVGLVIPSVIVPTESNLLLNPAHPEFDLRWVVSGPTPVVFDSRLLPS